MGVEVAIGMDDEDPLVTLGNEFRAERQRYIADVLNSRPFQDALNYLESITSHLLIAQTYVRLQGSRFSAGNDYLLFRFAPHLVESALAVTSCAKEGMQNAARRELRFLLEAAVKLSSRDSHDDATKFEDRLAGLGDRGKRFSIGLEPFDLCAKLRPPVGPCFGRLRQVIDQPMIVPV